MPTSLISLVGAMVIVGIMALMAAPSLSSVDRDRHAAVLRQFEYLVTLARERSASTDIVHGVRWDRGSRTFDVIQADFAQSPPVVLGTAFDPVTKQPAQVVLPDHLRLSPDSPFTFATLGAVGTLYFDRHGTPVNRLTGNNLQLQSGQLRIEVEDWQGTITVQPVSGRVTVN